MLKTLAEFPRFNIVQNSFGWRLTQHKGQGVIVLPRVEGCGLVVVREPRILPCGELGFAMNLPRGGIEPEYTPAENALKELEEETGISASLDQVRFLGVCAPDNGSLSIHIYCFEATLTKEQWLNRKTVQEENLESILLSEQEFLTNLYEGVITDGIGSHVYLMSGRPRNNETLEEHFLDVELALSDPIEADEHEELMRLREGLSKLCNPVGIPFQTDGASISIYGFLYADQVSREKFFSGVKALLSNKK